MSPERPPLVREFSAGGLVVRRFRGRPWVAAVRVKNGLALPKGIIDPGETAAEAALREVREEAGLETRLVHKLGDVRYWYTRPGARVMKVVSFFLLAYRRGSVRDHDDEVLGAEWVPLAEARLASPTGESARWPRRRSSAWGSRRQRRDRGRVGGVHAPQPGHLVEVAIGAEDHLDPAVEGHGGEGRVAGVQASRRLVDPQGEHHVVGPQRVQLAQARHLARVSDGLRPVSSPHPPPVQELLDEVGARLADQPSRGRQVDDLATRGAVRVRRSDGVDEDGRVVQEARQSTRTPP